MSSSGERGSSLVGGMRWTATVLGVAALVAAGAPRVGAQADPTSSSTSTSTSTSPTTAPDAVPPTVVGASPPPAADATVLPAPVPGAGPVPLEGEIGVASGPFGQAAFDPASRQVLAAELAGARRRLRLLERRLGTELRAAREVTSELDEVESAASVVDDAAAARAVEASTAREELRRAVVGAYVLDGVDLGLVAMLDEVEDLSRARVYLRSMSDRRQLAVERFGDLRAGLGVLGERLVDDAAPLRTALGEREAAAGLLVLAAEQTRAEVAAYEAGSHVAVAGFRFPVLGPVSFIDSWGFPRMAGTPSAHWHEGVDVIAPEGRELVAAEDGVLHDIGVAGLGGTKLWIRGRSGVDYYYAHLSGYAPGVADGVEVAAGQVVGYLGDTGNASGGVPHLHFEVHPDAGAPVNPYPLMWASLGRPDLPSEAEVLAGPARILAPGVSIAPR